MLNLFVLIYKNAIKSSWEFVKAQYLVLCFSYIILTIPVSKGPARYVFYADDTTLLIRSNVYKNLDTMTERAETEEENWFTSNDLVTVIKQKLIQLVSISEILLDLKTLLMVLNSWEFIKTHN